MLASIADQSPLLPQSTVEQDGMEFCLARLPGQRLRLIIAAAGDDLRLGSFTGETMGSIFVAPLTPDNAAALRACLPWLRPQLLGLRTSAGLGDRLGLATPGHVRAVKAVGGDIAPIFAQQSIREMARTGRSPQQVMDDAMWGVFQEGWRSGFGADADHLKTTAEIDECLAAGYTFFTIDPGDHVDNRAEAASASELRELCAALPPDLRGNASGLLGKTLDIEHLSIHFDEPLLNRAMAKYGRAVWHVASLYRHLLDQAGQDAFELEVSVDETAQPTSLLEHAYIASELRRLGVQWVSLAPRYLGDFEKGVDYIGDVDAFERDVAGHAAIARHFGPYKLSLHSGSDKFSIYPAATRQTRGLVHLKTAGTSYLEALRTIAAMDEGLFFEIYRFARERYETDRLTYHVSAQLARAPLPADVHDPAALLNQFDAREILHVTFGSVLKAQAMDGSPLFRERFMTVLDEHAEAYAANIERHFIKHLSLFLAQPT